MTGLPYYKINKLLWRWSERDGAVPVQAKLSLDKAPPALPTPPTSTQPGSPPPRPKRGFWDDVLTAAEARRNKKTSDPTPKKTPPPPVKAEESVPPFDIQEIPGAMRKEMMPVGAKLMERWFSGRLNYPPSSANDYNESHEINQDGKPYLPDMYDYDTVKLDWALNYARTKEKYDLLVKTRIYSQGARKILAKQLRLYRDEIRIITEDICGGDIRRIHEFFQFEFVNVDGSMADKINTQLMAEIERSGVPDDLSAALGSFNIYAAIGSARFSRSNYISSNATVIAEITGIWVYIKDNYTFTDEIDGPSQYLGHWSSDGVIVVPMAEAKSFSNHVPHIDSPVIIGSPFARGNTHYPIHNSNFRAC